MGIYDVYGSTQLKVGDPYMAEFKIGDAVEIADGLYLGWDGFVVVQGGKFVAEFTVVTYTHGQRWQADTVLSALFHPIESGRRSDTGNRDHLPVYRTVSADLT